MDRTRTLSRHVSGAAARPVRGRQADDVGLHLLDTLASVVACRDLPAAVVARRSLALAGRTGTGVPVLGTAERSDVAGAAFAGAMTAHAAELNDFMPAVLVQPGPAVVATALAVGCEVGAGGPALLGALAVGFELAGRLPAALGQGNLRRAGLASHGAAPCLGAAATAAALHKLSAEQVADLLSLTAQQASGSWQWLLDVEHVEKAVVFAGLGARAGVEGVQLVRAGYRGVPDVLDRDGTWWTTLAQGPPRGDGDLDLLVRDLGSGAELAGAAFKRHPVGGPTQPAVEALLALAPSCPAGEVERVLVEMPGRWEAFRDAAMPALSLPYLAAVVLLDGELGVVASQDLDRMHADPATVALAARVEVRHDPEQEAAPGAERPESARVTVWRRDGSCVSRSVSAVLGYPSHPMARTDVEDKARALVAPVLGADRAQALVEACRDVAATDAATLVRLVAPG